MSAARLREAAKVERRDWGGEENARLYPTASAIHLALADWLDLSARRMDEGLGLPGDYAKGPLRIADLILGGEPQ